jgi:hypothetical protein
MDENVLKNWQIRVGETSNDLKNILSHELISKGQLDTQRAHRKRTAGRPSEFGGGAGQGRAVEGVGLETAGRVRYLLVPQDRPVH